MKFLRKHDWHPYALSLPAAFPEYIKAGRTHPTPFWLIDPKQLEVMS